MKRRIIIGLGLVLALCLIGDAIVMLALRASVRELSTFVEAHRIQSLRADLVAASVRADADLRSFLPDHERTPEDLILHRRRLEGSVHSCAGCHHRGPAQEQLREIRGMFHEYDATLNQFLAESDSGRRGVLAGQLRNLSDKLVQQTSEMAEGASRHLVEQSARVADRVGDTRFLLLGTLVAVLTLGGFVAFHLRQHLTRPFQALLDDVEHVRHGQVHPDGLAGADEEFRTLSAAIHRAYDELLRAQSSLREAEKQAAVGKLAAGVAHEVFNPLASISSTTQLMRRQCTDDPQAEQLDKITQETFRIFRLVREIFMYAQPPKGDEHQPIDLTAVVAQARAAVESDPRVADITIQSSIDPDAQRVSGDAERLAMAFTNIMMNSVDAIAVTGARAGRITISARRSGDRVAIEFADDGRGMNADQIAHAFEPFVTTKEPGTGTGLGLWICYQIIHRHGGTIRLRSTPGSGTTVVLELPAANESPA